MARVRLRPLILKQPLHSWLASLHTGNPPRWHQRTMHVRTSGRRLLPAFYLAAGINPHRNLLCRPWRRACAPQRRRFLPLFFLALRRAPDPAGPAPGGSALPGGGV